MTTPPNPLLRLLAMIGGIVCGLTLGIICGFALHWLAWRLLALLPLVPRPALLIGVIIVFVLGRWLRRHGAKPEVQTVRREARTQIIRNAETIPSHTVAFVLMFFYWLIFSVPFTFILLLVFDRIARRG